MIKKTFYSRFTPDQLDDMHSIYNGHKISETFIYNYEAADVAAIRLSSDSANIWDVSPPDRQRMVEEINSSKLEYFI